jgi:hypothetical protein
MKANYRISEDDYVNGSMLAIRPTLRLLIIWLAAVLTLLALSMFYSQAVIAGVIGGLAGGLSVFLIWRYLVLPIQTRRNYRKYKAIHGEITVELLEEGLRFTSPDADGKLIWPNILKWRQNDSYILVYPMPRLCHILPKSVASSGFDVSLLVNQLTRHVGDPA